MRKSPRELERKVRDLESDEKGSEFSVTITHHTIDSWQQDDDDIDYETDDSGWCTVRRVDGFFDGLESASDRSESDRGGRS